MSDSEDIIVTLDGEEDSDGVDIEELGGSHNRPGIPIRANSGGGILSEDDDRFSSSPTTTAFSSEDEDESDTNSRRDGSEIGGLGGLSSQSGSFGTAITVPGRKSSLVGDVEAKVFNSEAEHKAYKRLKALEEIIETERAYVRDLDTLTKVHGPSPSVCC
jgi:hypothetical protein